MRGLRRPRFDELGFDYGAGDSSYSPALAGDNSSGGDALGFLEKVA